MISKVERQQHFVCRIDSYLNHRFEQQQKRYFRLNDVSECICLLPVKRLMQQQLYIAEIILFTRM